MKAWLRALLVATLACSQFLFLDGVGAVAPLQKLAGETILSGSKPAAMRVLLPKRVRFGNPLAGEDSIHTTGRGSFVGFALVAEEVPDREGFVMLGGRLPKSGGSRHFADLGGDWFSVGTERFFTLQPGVYTLYLIPGRGAATVRLSFEGLAGSKVLAPNQQVGFRMEPGVRRFEGLPDNYYAVGATGKLGGRGLVFGATWFEADAHVATNSKICFWRNQPRDPDAYGPTCGDMVAYEPGNSWGSSQETDGAESGSPFKLYSASWHPFSSGFKKPGLKYGVSQVIETVSVPANIDSLSFWLTYL